MNDQEGLIKLASIFVAGDIVNYQNNSGHILADDLAELVSAADLAICNFEAPIQGAGSPQVKSGPHHSQRAETLAGLQRQGFDVALLANNHIMDYGSAGLEATLVKANEAGLATVGAGLTQDIAYAPLIQVVDGLKIGIVNACEAQFGVIDNFTRGEKAGYAWINSPTIDRLVIKLRKQCDFVLVFAHAGLEHYSIPQKEWRERYRHLCHLGADAVIGSHPHVPQGYEQFGSSVIVYSLGNFYFDSKKYAHKEDRTYSVLLNLSKPEGTSIKPIFHYKHGGLVRLSPKDKQIDLMNLNRQLGDDYESLHDEMSLQAYTRIRRNFRTSLNMFPFNPDPARAIKRGLNQLIGRTPHLDKDVLQLHMLRNEAYYFAARHALEVKVRQKIKPQHE